MAGAPAAFEAAARFDGQRLESVCPPRRPTTAFSRRFAPFPAGKPGATGAFVSAPASQPAIRTRR